MIFYYARPFYTLPKGLRLRSKLKNSFGFVLLIPENPRVKKLAFEPFLKIRIFWSLDFFISHLCGRKRGYLVKSKLTKSFGFFSHIQKPSNTKLADLEPFLKLDFLAPRYPLPLPVGVPTRSKLKILSDSCFPYPKTQEYKKFSDLENFLKFTYFLF